MSLKDDIAHIQSILDGQDLHTMTRQAWRNVKDAAMQTYIDLSTIRNEAVAAKDSINAHLCNVITVCTWSLRTADDTSSDTTGGVS